MKDIGMKFLRGFTLLELMIAIAILGIALGIAVPGFTDLLRSYRAQSQSSEITRTVALARSEAIKRGGNVYVTALTDGDNWEAGWRVWHDADSNGIYAAAELIRAFGPLGGNGVSLEGKSYTTVGGVVTPGSASEQFRFTAQGLQQGVPPGQGLLFEFSLGDDFCPVARDMQINHIGRVSTARKDCDDDN
ncbi:GspH/FimT family pseudopilin [Stutzerimonas xanthomarina]|uniref:GspH/FimT family pseudopilin n=1 Tax=Stutzerimonas xanthomarina TaxID=271420 RepID=UPI003AA8D4DE